MKVIGGLIGLVILFYLCFLPIYVLFYNSSEGAVKDLSLESNLENMIDISDKYGQLFSIGDKSIILNEIHNYKKLCKKNGINIDTPAYILLKKNKNVYDLKIIDHIKEGLGTVGQLSAHVEGVRIYEIVWKKDGRNYSLPVVVFSPSFFKVRRALAITPDDQTLVQIYGL